MANSRKKLGIILLLATTLLFTGCSESEETQASLKQKTLLIENIDALDRNLTDYHIKAVFDPEEASLSATQRIDYVNAEASAIDRIYFHLYPNNFRKNEDNPFLFDSYNSAYPDGFEPGYIEVSKASIDGEPVSVEYTDSKQTIMKLSFEKAIAPSEKKTIELEYKIKLPPAVERFGYGESAFNFGNWYPVIAVYDDDGWNLDPYYSIGDPFYSDTANYFVEIETPKDFTIASSGNILENGIEGDKRRWKIEAKYMRDFAWVTSDQFTVIERIVDDTVVKCYFLKDWRMDKDVRDKAVASAEQSLKTFNSVFGKYPYGQYSVVQTNFPTGMEYPGLVLIGRQYYRNDWLDYLEIIIVHETAHQWWYGVVGNDQIDEAWLDESLASYSEVIYFMERFGEDAGQEYHEELNVESYMEWASYAQNRRVLKPLDQFEGWSDYGALVYSRGAMLLNEIYVEYGEETLYRMLSDYYEEYMFKHATTEDFKEVAEKTTGEDLDPIFNAYLLESESQ